MKIQFILSAALLAAVISSGGCGLFGKKPEEKSTQQIIQEQHELNRQIDSLKKIQLNKEIDSLRIVLDSSSKNLNETMQKILKSDEMKKDIGPKVK